LSDSHSILAIIYALNIFEILSTRERRKGTEKYKKAKKQSNPSNSLGNWMDTRLNKFFDCFASLAKTEEGWFTMTYEGGIIRRDNLSLQGGRSADETTSAVRNQANEIW